MIFDSELVAFLCIIFVIFQIVKLIAKFIFTHCHIILYEIGIRFVEFKYLGKWAVVTGATDGIGKAYAERLAKEGLNIFLISRSQAKLDEAAEQIQTKYKVETKTLAIDFTDNEEIYNTIEKNLVELEVGVLVNNVGISYEHPEYFLQVEGKDELYTNILKCNCLSMVNMCKIVMPGMVERKKGAIINLSSMAAQIPNPLLSVYAGSKAFVEKFSKDLSVEYDDKGLTIQCVMPGYVATKMSKIKTQTVLAPSPKIYVDEAILTLGIHTCTTGYFAHEWMMWIVHCAELFSTSLANAFVMSTLDNIRKRALKQKLKDLN